VGVFRKSVETIEVRSKPDKNFWYFTWRPVHIYGNMQRILLSMRNVPDKSCRQNQNTSYVQFFSLQNHAVYEIKWKNMVKPDRSTDDDIIRRRKWGSFMPDVFCKATDTRLQ
jgi:hypothetical protein